MFKVMYRDSVVCHSMECRKTKNNHRVCKVDQFAGREFNKNPFGHISNSIASMARASTYQEFLMIAQSIAQSPAKYNLPDDYKLQDALAMCRPRMAQSPAELDVFAEQLAQMDLRNIDEAYIKALKLNKDDSMDSNSFDSNSVKNEE